MPITTAIYLPEKTQQIVQMEAVFHSLEVADYVERALGFGVRLFAVAQDNKEHGIEVTRLLTRAASTSRRAVYTPHLINHKTELLLLEASARSCNQPLYSYSLGVKLSRDTEKMCNAHDISADVFGYKSLHLYMKALTAQKQGGDWCVELPYDTVLRGEIPVAKSMVVVEQ
jgi:hypothetical protein